MHPWDRTEPNKPSPASVKAASASRQRKLYTLVLPLDLTSGRILLGFKKRGFGAQKYNGFGGKVEPTDASILAAAIRELEEESCLSIPDLGTTPKSHPIHQVGILLLETADDLSQPILEIHVFIATSWAGKEQETEEMRPQWFSALPSQAGDTSNELFEGIPYDQMWEESRVWVPPVLSQYFTCNGSAQNVENQAKPFIHMVVFSGGVDDVTEEDHCWWGIAEDILEYLDPVDVGQQPAATLQAGDWGEHFDVPAWLAKRDTKRNEDSSFAKP